FASGLIASTVAVVLQADHSGQCMNVNGASKSSGANIIQWPCSGATNEQWTLVPQGTRYQVIAKNSGLCLTVNGNSNASGATLVQTACSTAGNELWTLKPVGRAYQLVAQNSGLCATVNNASQSSATQLVQTSCDTSLNKLWSMSLATLPSSWTGIISLAVDPIAVANLPNGKLV